MKTLYEALLMDHYRNPRHRGTLPEAHFASAQHNPSCGDAVSFAGSVADGVITTIAFEGNGCVISQATASLLAECTVGLPCNAVLAFDTAYVLNLIGMPQLGLTRLKCALLPLDALQAGVKAYLNQQAVSQEPKNSGEL